MIPFSGFSQYELVCMMRVISMQVVGTARTQSLTQSGVADCCSWSTSGGKLSEWGDKKRFVNFGIPSSSFDSGTLSIHSYSLKEALQAFKDRDNDHQAINNDME